jgi:hypothetical protein
MAPETIKARPTTFNGIRMRSRLEADYAAYINSTGRCRWQYEPECFASDAGQWLPDFGSSYADEGPLGIFTEVKPAGPLRALIPASVAYVDHVDAILRRMTIAWASRPDACLSLVFWEYGGPDYLWVFSVRRGAPWMAVPENSALECLWIGMGQYERLRQNTEDV